MSDYIVRGTAGKGQIRVFAATTKGLTEESRRIHDTTPVATAALGRLLTAGTMMGPMMKDIKDLLTIKIDCDGPIKGLLVTADTEGNVKGYVKNPYVDLPLNDKGKLDVGGALDLGVLSVIRDTGLKEPYVGQTILVSGEIAEDLTYYFASSEQVPSSVALGVLVNPDGTVRQAGGFIIQILPGAEDAVIDQLEKRLGEITSVTTMLEEGMSPEDILNQIFADMDLDIMQKMPVQYHCDCSRERFSRGIASIQTDELESMIHDGEPIEVRCQFCGKNYMFTPEELQEMLNQRQKNHTEAKVEDEAKTEEK